MKIGVLVFARSTSVNIWKYALVFSARVFLIVSSKVCALIGFKMYPSALLLTDFTRFQLRAVQSELLWLFSAESLLVFLIVPFRQHQAV